MASALSKRTVLLVGAAFHLAFILSIFDIYFVSPLVHGMQHFSSPEPAPAQRLFLVVGDGLRADKCFANITHPTTGHAGYLAPFIRSKVLEHGTFGVSHTRMPTESRPGHVALIAGFYEDVSAVTKGWKENPVDFDSVFNQSRHTYSFGSPDILPMFASGASDPSRIDTFMYGHDFEDFTKGSIELDEFVFDHMDRLLKEAATNKTLDAALRQDKIVFFLHLLGIDTAGHSYRPYSAEYYDNIAYIDAKLKDLEQMVNDFYHNDGRTAWVFTADHGMSDFGSHGDGHPDNTRTPLVAWGAGVPRPNTQGKGDHDSYSEPWQLGSVKRNDVNQADIAPLMSYLLGLNYPANSVGELPLEYIDAPDRVLSQALSGNAFAIAEQYLVKEAETSSLQLKYTPFGPLGEVPVANRTTQIKHMIESHNYHEAIQASEDLMMMSLRGLRYLQTYNWIFMRTLVTLGFVGWIGYATTSFLHLFIVPEAQTKNSTTIRLTFASILAALCSFLYFQQSPPHFYLYAVFPVFFWDQVAENTATVRRGLVLLVERLPSKSKTQIAVSTVVFGLVLLESIVYGYFHREIFSVCFIAAIFWPLVQNMTVVSRHLSLYLTWAVLCLIMSVFTLLPAVKSESLVQIVAAAVLMVASSIYYTTSLGSKLKLSATTLIVCGIQIGLIVLTTIVTFFSVRSLQARQGLPLGNQVVGWMSLILSLVVPFLHSSAGISDYRFRLLTVYLAFCPTFVILTISNEGLFYVTFFATLLVWSEFESLFYFEGSRKGSGSNFPAATAASNTNAVASRDLHLGDFRLSLFFFYLAQIGFFGIGNIASISSFSLDSVTRLIPIFDPFTMGALLLFKLLVPFAVLSVFLGILNLRLGVPASALFAMVLSVSDILSLNFFYLVVDEGSWLDIGTGISHFCVASGLCLFMVVLEYLSGLLVRGVLVDLDTKTK